MRDLGTLGGTQSITTWLNNRGEVVGQSNLTADHTFHPFLWDGEHLRDLGTLGGDYGLANYINDAEMSSATRPRAAAARRTRSYGNAA